MPRHSHRCCIPSCSSTSLQEGISFHEFPSNEVLRRKWFESLHISEAQQTLPDRAQLCSRHFTEGSFKDTPTGRKLLNRNAVPFLFWQNADNPVPIATMSQRSSQNKRSDNFSTAETEVLLRLIKRSQDIIESKKVDRVTCEVKSRKWEEICRLFNKHFGTARTVKSLRNKYDNHKRRHFNRKHQLQNLAPYQASVEKSDPNFEDILGDPLEGHFVDIDDDSDFSLKSSPSGENTESMPVKEINYVENIKMEMVEEDANFWSNAAPAELRPSLLHPPRNSEENGLPNPCGKLLQEKLDYVKLQKQILLEEHQLQKQLLLEEQQLKLKHMKELHEKQMIDLDLSIELKRKQLSN